MPDSAYETSAVLSNREELRLSPTPIFERAFHDLFLRPSPAVIPWLDLLRTAAILSVVGGHTMEFGFMGLAAKAFYWGWTGVDLFFVLSGYLIANQLWKELQKSGTLNVGRFLIKRGLRIWPLYFATVTGYLLWDIATQHGLEALRFDALFLSNYFNCQVKGGWSLSTEEQFYILFPLLLLLFRKLPAKTLVFIPVAWLFALPMFRHLALSARPGATPGDVIYSPFHTHSDGLAIGALIAWISVFFGHLWRSPCRKWSIAGFGISIAVAMKMIGGTALSYTALGLIYGSLVLIGLHAPVLNRVASWRGFHVISRLSYGVYLNHLVIIEGLQSFMRRHVAPASTNPFVFIFTFLGLMGLSLITAFVTFSLIEKPFLNWRERWMSESKPVTQVAAPAPVA